LDQVPGLPRRWEASPGDVRYNSLAKENPEHFKQLFEAAQNNAKWRYAGYKRMAAQSFEAAK